MALKRCNTCLGEYHDPQPDGATYFHVCPLVTIIEGRDAAGVTVVGPLESFGGSALLDAAAVQAIRDRGDALTPRQLEVLARREEPRPHRRDEHTLRYEGEKGERRVLRREGRGVTVLDPRDAFAERRGRAL